MAHTTIGLHASFHDIEMIIHTRASFLFLHVNGIPDGRRLFFPVTFSHSSCQPLYTIWFLHLLSLTRGKIPFEYWAEEGHRFAQ